MIIVEIVESVLLMMFDDDFDELKWERDKLRIELEVVED